MREEFGLEPSFLCVMGSSVQEGFVLLPLKPQSVSEPHGVQLVPKGAVLGLIPCSTPCLAQSKACSLCPTLGWGQDRQGPEEGLALWQEKHSLALPHRWHPVQQPTRLHSPHTGLAQRTLLSAFKIMAIHCKTKYPFPNGYQ